MRSSSQALAALMFLLLATPVTAPAQPMRLTIDEAVARALSANVAFKSNRQNVTVAEAGVQRSRAWLPSNPYLSAGAQRTSQSGIASNYAFYLSQEFEVAGQRSKRINVATEGAAMAKCYSKTAEQNLVATVKTDFTDVLVNQERVTLAQQGVDIAANLVTELTKEHPDTDLGRLNLNVAQIQESRARRQLAAAQRVRDDTLDSLRRILDLPMEQAVELAGAPRHQLRSLPTGPALVARALRDRSDLIALRHGVKFSDQQLSLMRREWIPNLTLSGTFSHFEGDTLAGGDLGLPIPIFQGKSADVAQAVAEREQAKLQLQDLKGTITQNTLAARRACVVAGADVKAYQETIVPKSEENLRLEQALFDRGEVMVADLVGLQIDLLTARGDYLDAVQTYNDALIELERVIGGSLDRE